VHDPDGDPVGVQVLGPELGRSRWLELRDDLETIRTLFEHDLPPR
jgi:hypothetical protein